jgi:hypothetical protein
MASFPVMLSDSLAEDGQTAAEDNRRSLSSQIEHWAWFGKAAESLLSLTTVATLKRCNGNLDALPDHGEREQVERELAKLRLVLASC